MVGEVKLPADLDWILGGGFNPFEEEEDILLEPVNIASTPIANTEFSQDSYKPQFPAVESVTQQILDAQKTVEFWKNYVKRINLNLQNLSKSFEM